MDHSTRLFDCWISLICITGVAARVHAHSIAFCFMKIDDDMNYNWLVVGLGAATRSPVEV